MFIAVDGPNGVGKSTFIDNLVDELKQCGKYVNKTREPTDSMLGKYIRKSHDGFSPEFLALALSLDRYHHLITEIYPSLVNDRIVITDRYVASSLVYQVSDGVREDIIKSLNVFILLPSIQIFLEANIETINQRIEDRNMQTKFEKKLTSDMELNMFAYSRKYFDERGVEVIVLQNNSMEDLDRNVKTAKDRIINRITKIHAI